MCKCVCLNQIKHIHDYTTNKHEHLFKKVPCGSLGDGAT
jgi:hypothetical protein